MDVCKWNWIGLNTANKISSSDLNDPPKMWHLQLPLPEVNDDEGNPWPTLSATDDKRLILGLLA